MAQLEEEVRLLRLGQEVRGGAVPPAWYPEPVPAAERSGRGHLRVRTRGGTRPAGVGPRRRTSEQASGYHRGESSRQASRATLRETWRPAESVEEDDEGDSDGTGSDDPPHNEINQYINFSGLRRR